MKCDKLSNGSKLSILTQINPFCNNILLLFFYLIQDLGYQRLDCVCQALNVRQYNEMNCSCVSVILYHSCMFNISNIAKKSLTVQECT